MGAFYDKEYPTFETLEAALNKAINTNDELWYIFIYLRVLDFLFTQRRMGQYTSACDSGSEGDMQ